MTRAFSAPELQSKLGIFLIFGSSLYKALRGLWPLGAYLLFGKIDKTSSGYILIGAVLFFIGLFIFSVLSYLRFRFHIDYEKREFILQKGVFTTSLLAIPFDKIQQVYFKRSILQRIINVYEVVIDTAGSKAEEVMIKALTKKRADALQEILMQEADQQTEPENTSIERNEREEHKSSVEKPIWKHRLSLATLIRLGLSTSYLRGIWVLLIFGATLLQQIDTNLLGEDYNAQLESFYTNYININYLAQTLLIVLPIIFLVGILITSIEVFVKYYNLTLTQTSNALELEMGLRTNTRVSLKPRRVQVFRILTNPVQKRLNLYEVQLSLANSIDTAEKSKIKIPGLTWDVMARVREFLYPQDVGAILATFSPNVLLFTRKCMFSLIPLALGLGLWYLLLDFFRWDFVLPVVLVYFAAVIPYQWYYYRSMKLSFSEEFLIRTMGIWTQKTELVPLFKLQGITVKQPLWYRGRQLYNLVFHTAGGDIQFRAVDVDVLAYMNYCIYKVEVSREDWM